MSESSKSPRARKVPTRPAKPYASFPLTPHPNVQWVKKIRGQPRPDRGHSGLRGGDEPRGEHGLHLVTLPGRGCGWVRAFEPGQAEAAA
jgi:hypothetical protein